MTEIKWDRQRLKPVKQMIVDGYTVEEIANKLGYTSHQVRSAIARHTKGYRHIRAENGKPRNAHIPNGAIKWSEPEVVDIMVSKIQQGMTVDDLAKYFGAHPAAMRSAIHNNTDGLRVIRHRAGLPLTIT